MSLNKSVFEPPLFRCFAASMRAYLIGGSVAVLLLLAINVDVTPNITPIVGLMTIYLLGTLLTLRYTQRAWSIIITNDYVSGPSVWWGMRVEIPLSSLDRPSVGKERFIIRLLGGKYIRARDGEKIRIEQMAFTVEQAREMLEQLERRQSSSARSNQVYV